jgi:hypothetical protein
MKMKISGPKSLEPKNSHDVSEKILQIEDLMRGQRSGKKFYILDANPDPLNASEKRFIEKSYKKSGWSEARFRDNKFILWRVKDVHTEHCHDDTCKYGEESTCTVVRMGVPPTSISFDF